MAVEAGPVIGDDAGRLLAAMLQRVQAEGGHRRRVRHAPDAEYAAFLVQLVVLHLRSAHLEAIQGHAVLLFAAGPGAERPAGRVGLQQRCRRGRPTRRRRDGGPILRRHLPRDPFGAAIDRRQGTGLQDGNRPLVDWDRQPDQDIGSGDQHRTPHKPEYQAQRAVEAAERRSTGSRVLMPLANSESSDQHDQEHAGDGDGVGDGRVGELLPQPRAARRGRRRRRRRRRSPRRRGPAPRARSHA